MNKREKYEILEAKIYVGTYAKYNDGDLDGTWFELKKYETYQDFIDDCKRYHRDEEDPELFFQDWEYIPEKWISESTLDERFFDLKDVILKCLTPQEEEAFYVWLNDIFYDDFEKNAQEIVDSFLEVYFGHYESERDFAMDEVVAYGDMEHLLACYFDYDAYARDLFIDDYTFVKGYVFKQ